MDFGNIYGIEDIVVIVVVVVYINFVFVGEDVINFFIWQCFQCVGVVFVGVGVFEFYVLWVVDCDFFFMVQMLQYIICWQGEQFFCFNGFGKCCQVFEVGSLGILCWYYLQQYFVCYWLVFMIVGVDDKVCWQLF